jgi:DNA-binding XRE family transcriptional regulator
LAPSLFPYKGLQSGGFPLIRCQVRVPVIKLALDAHKIVLAQYAVSGYVASVMGDLLKKKLKAWRKKNRMVQKQAADVLGVNLRTYQGWEEGRGGNNPLSVQALELRMAQSEAGK